MSHQDENFMKVTWVKVKGHFEIFAMEIPIEKISIDFCWEKCHRQ